MYMYVYIYIYIYIYTYLAPRMHGASRRARAHREPVAGERRPLPPPSLLPLLPPSLLNVDSWVICVA